MSHAFYVFMSWGISALVIIGMTGAILLDGKRQKSHLKALEKSGIRRRSDLEEPET